MTFPGRRRLAVLIGLWMALASPAGAGAETYRLIDDIGREVAVPVRPARIVSLDDVGLTVPLLELGVIPVGSEGRIDPGGRRFLRSSLTLTGLDFDNTGMAFLGRNPVDVESVAALKPDLIVTLRNEPTPPEQLQQIAPTVVIDDVKRGSADIYGLLARLTGRSREAEILETRYRAQIAQLRRIADRQGGLSVSVLNASADGRLNVEHTYGGLGAVLRDAGFRFPALVEGLPANSSVAISPEALPELDSDLIFDTYRNDEGETPADARARMAALLPDYCRFLRACRTGRYFILPRDEAKSTSYAAKAMAAALVIGVISAEPAADTGSDSGRGP